MASSPPAGSPTAAQKRWDWAIRTVREDLAHGETPCFPLDKLHDFERLFYRNGQEISLDLEEFQEAFGDYGKFNRHQWRRLFMDIDADRGGTVSWDEFTTFMIHHSVCSMGDYHRSREFVPAVVNNKLNHCHKDFAGHILTCPKTKQLITAGGDGYVRVWDTDMSYVRSINNSKNSASSKLSSHGVISYPICDMALGGNGGVLAVSSIDKCINLYQTEGMTLYRRYIGRNLMNDVNIPAVLEPGVTRPVDTVILMGMQDAISSCDIASPPNGKENFVIGHMDGTVSVYPTMRHSLIADVRPSALFPIHKGPVHKVRLLPTEGIASCAWDKRVIFSDPETGAATASFNDSNVHGHLKYVTDFCYNAEMRLLTTIANADKDACLWTPQMPNPAARLQGHVMPIIGLTAHDAEYHLMTLSSDSVIKIWDTRTFRHFQTLIYSAATLKPTAVYYDTTNEQLVGLAGVPSSWRPRRAMTAFPPSYKGHIEPIVSILYQKDHDIVLTTDVCTTMSWSMRTGERSIAWEPAREGQQVASTCLDHSTRRLFVFTKSGMMNTYNHRSGQLLREWNASAPDSVAALSLCRPPNFFFVVVVCHSKIVVLQENGADWSLVEVPLPNSRWRFTTAVAGPHDNMGIPIALCGTSAGTVVGVCVETASVMYELCSSGTFSAKVRDPMQEFVGANRIKKQVECLVGLPMTSMALVGTGEKYLHAFILGQKPLYGGVCPLPVSALTMVSNCAETTLAMGDELGTVAVCNIFALRRAGASRRNFDYSTAIVPQHVFKAQSCSISKLLCIPHKSLLVVAGANSSAVVFTYEGKSIGMLGSDVWTPPPDAPILLPPREPRKRLDEESQRHVAVIVSPGRDARTSSPSSRLLSPTSGGAKSIPVGPATALSKPAELNPSAFFLTEGDRFSSIISPNFNDSFGNLQARDGDSSDDGADDFLAGVGSQQQIRPLQISRDRSLASTRSQRFVTDGRMALTPTIGHRTRAAILKIPETELARLRSTPTASKARKAGGPPLGPHSDKVEDLRSGIGGQNSDGDEDAEEKLRDILGGTVGRNTRTVSPPSRNTSPVKYRLPSRGALTPEPMVVVTAATTAARSSLSVMMQQSQRGSAARKTESRESTVSLERTWMPTTTDTGRKVRAAQLVNPKGWTSSISSYLAVMPVSQEVLEPPVASLKNNKMGRRRTLAPL
jgi:WD40 repeat protein